jgi:hypothetical protein
MQKRGHRPRWMMEVNNLPHFPTIDIRFHARQHAVLQNKPSNSPQLARTARFLPCFQNGRQAFVGVLGLR